MEPKEQNPISEAIDKAYTQLETTHKVTRRNFLLLSMLAFGGTACALATPTEEDSSSQTCKPQVLQKSLDQPDPNGTRYELNTGDYGHTVILAIHESGERLVFTSGRTFNLPTGYFLSDSFACDNKEAAESRARELAVTNNATFRGDFNVFMDSLGQ